MRLNLEEIKDRRCVIYTRVSTDDQDERGYSLDDQVERAKKFAEVNELEIVEIYNYPESAKAPGRKHFNAMLDYVKENKIPFILVDRVDRLYRNTPDRTTVYRLLPKGHDVVFFGEGRALSKDMTADEKMVNNILADIAEAEKDRIRERVMRGHAKKVKEGGLVGKARIGYMNVTDNGKKTVVLDPERAPKIREIFDMYLSQKYSITDITKEITKSPNPLTIRPHKKIKKMKDGTKKEIVIPGKIVHRSTVARILEESLLYTGFHKSSYREDEYKAVEGIITKKEAEEVKRFLKSKNTSFKSGRWFPFSNIGLICSNCGCKITGHNFNHNYIRYHCTHGADVRREQEGKKKCTLKKFFHPEEMDKLIFKNIVDFNFTKGLKELVFKRMNELYQGGEKKLKDKVKALKDELAKNKSYIDMDYQNLREGVITKDYFKQQNMTLMKRQKEIEEEIQEKEFELGGYYNFVDDVMGMFDLVSKLKKNWNNLEPMAKHEILRKLISKGTVFENKVQIDWNRPYREVFKVVSGL